MTTPERLHRRQRRDGVVLILLAIFIALQSVYFSLENREADRERRAAELAQLARDRAQADCLEEKFSELSAALEIRGDLTKRESEVTKDVLLVYARAAGIVREDPTQELPQQAQEQLQRDLVEALLTYRDVIEGIQDTRRKHPLPPYPVGVCADGDGENGESTEPSESPSAKE